MRTVELARAAGVSTQTVRNLEQRGVIPTAGRTPTGYRYFENRHMAALQAYRKVAGAFGVGPANQILPLITAGDPDAAFRIVTSLVRAIDEERERLGHLIEALGNVPETPATPSRGQRSIAELARHLQIKPSTLRVWEREGLIAPGRDPATGYRRFTETDAQQARVVLALRRAGIGIPPLRPVMAQVRGSTSPTAALEALGRRESQLAEQTRRAVCAIASLDAFCRS